MNVHDVKLSKKEELTVLVRAIYDFIPLSKLSFAIAMFSGFMYLLSSAKNEHGVIMPLASQLAISTIFTAASTAIVFLLLPIIYEDLWENTIVPRFQHALHYRKIAMQEAALKRADEIILQQKRQ